MKKLSYFVLLLLVSCGLSKIDQQKAQAVAEGLLNDIKSENYQNLDQYYTASFNESEPLEQKTEKYKKLKDAMGPIESFELISTKENTSMDNGGPSIALTYKVKCSRIMAGETFIIINDEGHHKITFQNITSQN